MYTRRQETKEISSESEVIPSVELLCSLECFIHSVQLILEHSKNLSDH